MVLNEKIEVRHSPIQGYGLFAKAAIAKGEWVWRETPAEFGRCARVRGRPRRASTRR
jgi:hypothetical protein